MTVFFGEEKPKIAYFSMEIGLSNELPTYSGGLGILAGDTIRSAADLRVPLIAVTLLHRKGYFSQRLRQDGTQIPESVNWDPSGMLRELPARASVTVCGTKVLLRAWQFDAKGGDGFIVPVLFLDTDLPDNDDWGRNITDHLYGGDRRYRLCQEAVPTFYGNRDQYIRVMRNCIALNGSFFSTHRMLQEYVLKAYFR